MSRNVTPFGMRNTLQWIKDRFNNPAIVVTENGFRFQATHIQILTRSDKHNFKINETC